MSDMEEFVASSLADPDVVDLITDIFGRHRASRSDRNAAEVVFDKDLWAQLDELGLTRLSTTEASGGSGASWLESAALLNVAAASAANLPVAEHDVLAGWLLETAGIDNDGALRTVCRPDSSGVAVDVPWVRDAASVVALWEGGDGWQVVDVPVTQVEIAPGRNLAGEPSDTVRFDLADLEVGTAVDAVVAEQFHLRGALARSVQVTGAMERVVEIVLEHVREREQFGRPIGRFQVVQHLLADVAMEAALSRTATDTAVARAAVSDWQDPGVAFAVAVAKSCTGHAASVVVRGAHQLLGALGTTLEHELHTLTNPILVRRREYGSVHDWDATLAALARSAGRDDLWPLVLTGHTADPGDTSDTAHPGKTGQPIA